MCGICGIINTNQSEIVERQQIVKMRDTMVHRGPDGHGVWCNNNIGLGHRRLSVIDTSDQGRQPMANRDGNIFIVYNGEFYNYEEHRTLLEKRGYKFQSSSDTEVILFLYEIYGLEETLKRINGMFSFCLVDLRENVQYLVRDRFGIKPLYYLMQDDSISFASEIKALYKKSGFVPKIRKQAVIEYSFYSRLVDYSTLIENIYEVKPGTYLKIENGNVNKNVYYNLENVNKNINISLSEAIEEFDRLFTQAVSYRMVSDVPIGLFLSGGLDSSLIGIKMSELSDKPINTISGGFHEKGFNEFLWSDLVADRIKSEHTKHYFTNDQFSDLQTFMNYIYDMPTSTGPHLYLLSKYAKERGITVMLCGQGADEILGGYPQSIKAHIQNKVNSSLFKLLGQNGVNFLSNNIPKIGKNKLFQKGGERINLNESFLAGAYATRSTDSSLNSMFKDTDEDMYLRLLSQYEKNWPVGENDFTQKRLVAEMHRGLQRILQNTDRFPMAAGIETRVPFLEHDLVEFIFSLKTEFKIKRFEGKYLLKKYAGKYFNNKFINRSKMGFPIPTMKWLTSGKYSIPKEWNEDLELIFNTNKFKENLSVLAQKSFKKNELSEMKQMIVFNDWMQNINTDIDAP